MQYQITLNNDDTKDINFLINTQCTKNCQFLLIIEANILK